MKQERYVDEDGFFAACAEERLLFCCGAVGSEQGTPDRCGNRGRVLRVESLFGRLKKKSLKFERAWSMRMRVVDARALIERDRV